MHYQKPRHKGASPQQLIAVMLAFSFLPTSIAQEQEAVAPLTEMGGANCTFKADPDEYVAREARVRETVNERALFLKLGRYSSGSRTAAPGTIEPKNFIDEAIFGKLAAAGARGAWRLRSTTPKIGRAHV